PLPSTAIAPCSGAELRQVLLNLLLNALDASPPGSTVTLEVKQTADAFEFTVTDQGAGVLVKASEDIFSPFVSTKQHGSGLGLHIAHKIMERHGGSIAWENLPGGGACFRASLPAMPPENHPGQQTSPSTD
ncbi:MAG TPA: sensor histidine kinase, partial [Lentisphaeria bacterium]|nr:sensor histidine kinase [Lentisphaeria bacterium]